MLLFFLQSVIKDKRERGGLIVCPVSRIIVVDPPSGPISSPTMGSWPDLQYKACVSSCRVSLKSSQNAFGYPCNIQTTISIMDTSYACHYYSAQCSQTDKTFDGLYPPVAYLAPSSTMSTKASRKEASGSVVTLSLCSVTRGYGAFISN